MGRRKKNFAKKYDFDDFCITTDIYKKDVLFFMMSFSAIREDNSIILDLTEAKEEIKKALENSFNGIKAARRNMDIWMGDVSKGKSCSIKLFGAFYIKNKDEIPNIENEILEKSKELMNKEKLILNKYSFVKFTKPEKRNKK